MNIKKVVISSVAIAVVAVMSVIGYAYANNMFSQKQKPSDYHVGIKYEQALQSDKPMLALFYADWCGYCLKFMPRFETISKLYKNDFNAVMLDVDNPDNRELIEDVAIGGFPTVFIFDPKYDNRVMLSNGIYQDMKKLRVELDRFLRIRRMLDKAENAEVKQ